MRFTRIKLASLNFLDSSYQFIHIYQALKITLKNYLLSQGWEFMANAVRKVWLDKSKSLKVTSCTLSWNVLLAAQVSKFEADRLYKGSSIISGLQWLSKCFKIDFYQLCLVFDVPTKLNKEKVWFGWYLQIFMTIVSQFNWNWA